MEKKHLYIRHVFYFFLISFLLIGTTLEGTGFGGESGGVGSVPMIQDSEEALLDTGKPGLGGENGAAPLIFPAGDEKVSTSTNEAQALEDGYAVVAYVEEGGDTGSPGLGGYTGGEVQNSPVEGNGSNTNQ